jgi:Arc/MetJ family transcription regulator
MALTQVDIDEDALAEAMRLSGSKTKTEAVNAALRELARHRRAAAQEVLADFLAGWEAERGALTAEEIARAERELGLP